MLTVVVVSLNISTGKSVKLVIGGNLNILVLSNALVKEWFLH
jgi:hypothetical protein